MRTTQTSPGGRGGQKNILHRYIYDLPQNIYIATSCAVSQLFQSRPSKFIYHLPIFEAPGHCLMYRTDAFMCCFWCLRMLLEKVCSWHLEFSFRGDLLCLLQIEALANASAQCNEPVNESVQPLCRFTWNESEHIMNISIHFTLSEDDSSLP